MMAKKEEDKGNWYNPYEGVYMLTYLTKSGGDYIPVASLDFCPELIKGTIDRIRQDVIRDVQKGEYRNAKIVGYMIKVNTKEGWKQVEKQILYK